MITEMIYTKYQYQGDQIERIQYSIMKEQRQANEISKSDNSNGKVSTKVA